MKLSVIIPVYNEEGTISNIIRKVKSVKVEKEIIVVDDFSTDGTKEILENSGNLKIIFHDRNRGKGAAIKTGLKCVSGEVVIIQDADMEYDPQDYHKLLEPIIKKKAQAVYGSRFMGKGEFFVFPHYIGNKFLTFCTNLLFNSHLTDMETCYKMVRTDVLKSLKLESNRFEIEPEITAKLLKKGYKIYEVPVYYKGRQVWEGKKIGWKDGFIAFFKLMKYRLF